MDITTVNNFIKDCVIDHVLKDLDLTLQDVAAFDEHTSDCFEILCAAKYRSFAEGVS